jgi:polyisoprenoid-binding protein YceI
LKRFITILAVTLFAVVAFGETKTYTITDDGKNYAMFESQATLETIHGTTTKVAGSIVADPRDAGAAKVEINIDLASLETGIAMRNQHMRERFLQTSDFPTATFKSVGIVLPKAVEPNKPIEGTIRGDFTVHGVTKQITVPLRVVYIPESELTKSSRGPGDWIHATTNFTIKLGDYGIAVPQQLMLKLADSVDIKLDVFAAARPPKPATPPAPAMPTPGK